MKYCVNCEEAILVIEAYQGDIGDFCSDKCANEFINGCDPDLLARAQESNPHALPSFDVLSSPRINSGHLPPNTLDAVQSLLRIGGVSQEAIDNVVSIEKANKAAAIDKQMAESEEADVKDNSQNE